MNAHGWECTDTRRANELCGRECAVHTHNVRFQCVMVQRFASRGMRGLADKPAATAESAAGADDGSGSLVHGLVHSHACGFPQWGAGPSPRTRPAGRPYGSRDGRRRGALEP